jgi:hypothetical protein
VSTQQGRNSQISRHTTTASNSTYYLEGYLYGFYYRLTQIREINQSSWWLLITFPSMLISVPFNTCLQHPRWLKFSWIRSSSFMACHTLLFLIATQLSQAIFGKNCSRYKAPNCISTQLIIPRLMAKRSCQQVFGNIFEVFFLGKEKSVGSMVTPS